MIKLIIKIGQNLLRPIKKVVSLALLPMKVALASLASVFKSYWKLNSGLRILLAIILGIGVGLWLYLVDYQHNNYVQYISKDIGMIFLNLIMFVVKPLIFLLMIDGIMGTEGRLSVVKKIVATYLISSFVAISYGMLSGYLFSHDLGIDLLAEISNEDGGSIKMPVLYDMVYKIFPPGDVLTAVSILQVLCFSIILGFAGLSVLTKDPVKGKGIQRNVTNWKESLFKYIEYVMFLAPLTAFCFMIYTVLSAGGQGALSVAWMMIKGGLVIISYAFYWVIGLTIYHRIPPIFFIKKIMDMIIVAFVTAASKIALPVGIKIMQEKVGASKQTSDVTMTMGAGINMDATSAYLGYTSMTFAKTAGLALSLSLVSQVLITATIGSIGAGGYPGGSLVMMTIVFQPLAEAAFGNPELAGMAIANFIAALMGFDRLLDMVRTVVNITIDAIATIFVDISEGRFNIEKCMEGAKESVRKNVIEYHKIRGERRKAIEADKQAKVA